jgi:hypothetical protein
MGIAHEIAKLVANPRPLTTLVLPNMPTPLELLIITVILLIGEK